MGTAVCADVWTLVLERAPLPLAWRMRRLCSLMFVWFQRHHPCTELVKTLPSMTCVSKLCSQCESAREADLLATIVAEKWNHFSYNGMAEYSLFLFETSDCMRARLLDSYYHCLRQDLRTREFSLPLEEMSTLLRIATVQHHFRGPASSRAKILFILALVHCYFLDKPVCSPDNKALHIKIMLFLDPPYDKQYHEILQLAFNHTVY